MVIEGSADIEVDVEPFEGMIEDDLDNIGSRIELFNNRALLLLVELLFPLALLILLTRGAQIELGSDKWPRARFAP